MVDGLESIQVIGLGQACVDYVGNIPAFPAEDDKVELEGLFTSCGGPAATAMVTLARLGVATSFLGSISDDPFGGRIVESLKKEGIDISCLEITPGYASQFAFIVVTGEGGKRTIFWKRASAPELRPADVSLKRFPNARILHVDGLMIQACKAAAAEAKKRGILVVMDAGTLREGTLDLVSVVDVLIGSESFAAGVSESQGTYEKTLQKLIRMGPRQAVFTLGAEGSIGFCADGMVRQKGFPVKSTDSTGAGDVYHGAYVYGLLEGWTMAECMRFASAAAALKCARGGGWRGIPNMKSIQDLIQEE